MKCALFAAMVLVVSAESASQSPGERERWATLVTSGYVVPEGRQAIDVLLEANALLASTDPFLRDDVAFGAADPFLEPAEVNALFDRMLQYFGAEQDIRGFDAERGWMHAVAHTADTLKFLARNPKLAAGADVRLLGAVRARIEWAPTVFVWGENDRMALALQSAVRRPDADSAALTAWTQSWVAEHGKLWAGGPHVDVTRFARVENARQVMRSLHTALVMEAKPTPSGDTARQSVLAALQKMR